MYCASVKLFFKNVHYLNLKFLNDCYFECLRLLHGLYKYQVLAKFVYKYSFNMNLNFFNLLKQNSE